MKEDKKLTQYERKLVNYPNGMITQDKGIRHYCPSDLLECGVDDCECEYIDEELCRKCWDKEYVECDLSRYENHPSTVKKIAWEDRTLEQKVESTRNYINEAQEVADERYKEQNEIINSLVLKIKELEDYISKNE